MKTYHSGFFGSKSDSHQARDRVHVRREVKGHFRPGLKVILTVFLLLFGLAVSAGSAMAYTEGSSNNFFGTGAGASNSGAYNSFFGGYAGHSNTTGYSNAFFGFYAGFYNTTGNGNAFFGTGAGYWNTTGGSNAFFGRYAGYYNETGDYNAFFGRYAGYSNTVEDYNTFVGHFANLDPGDDPATEPVQNATAIGYRAYVSRPNSLVLGSIEGVNGAEASVNVGIGTPAPESQLHMVGSDACFRMDRSQDTAAFISVRTNESGEPLKTFVVGTNASGENNGEFIINDLGMAVSGEGARRMTITNDGEVHFGGPVMSEGSYVLSSEALVENVRTYENPLETVKRLHGVQFDWKKTGEPSVGLIAEEVEGVIPEVVAYGGDGGAPSGVNYASLVGLLVEAVKELQAELDQLKKKEKKEKKEKK